MTGTQSITTKYGLYLIGYSLIVLVFQLVYGLNSHISEIVADHKSEFRATKLTVSLSVRNLLQTGDGSDVRRIISAISNSGPNEYIVAVSNDSKITAVSSTDFRRVRSIEEVQGTVKNNFIPATVLEVLKIPSKMEDTLQVCLNLEAYAPSFNPSKECSDIWLFHDMKTPILRSLRDFLAAQIVYNLSFVAFFILALWGLRRILVERVSKIASFLDQGVTFGEASLHVKSNDEIGAIESGIIEYHNIISQQSREKENLVSELTNALRTDELTQVPNRRSLGEFISENAPEKGFLVIICDIDYFKTINDKYGHDVGDQFLKEFAQYIQRNGNLDFFCRLSGEEFCGVVGCRSESAKLAQLSHLQELCCNFSYSNNGAKISRSASFGAASTSEIRDFSEAMKYADIALLQSKRSGRSRWTYADDKFVANLPESFSVSVEELMEAIWSNSIQYFFQPIIDSGSGGMIGVEALVRWNRADGKVYAPDAFLDKFLPLTRDKEFVPLIQGILKESIESANLPKDVYISLNYELEEFQDEDFAENLIAYLQGVSDDCGRKFMIEISEKGVSSRIDLGRIICSLKALREQGVLIALDDFGVRDSNIQRVIELPIDVVKFDKLIIDDIVTNESRRIIVKKLSELFSAINVGLVVEGVESGVQADLLNELGLKSHQGYFYMKPVNPSIFHEISSLYNYSKKSRYH